MLLFRSEEHIDRWAAEDGTARGATMTVDQQWRFSYAWYADRMSTGWRRRTADEAHEVFAAIGLTGDFWRLA